MKKGTALIAMLLAAALMLSGCNLIGYDSELDGAQVVARVNDTELTKAEWQAYRDYLVSYMQDYYLQYFGISIPMTEEDVAAYGETALEQMIETVVIEEKLAELGFDPLGEEDAAEVESYADDMIEFYKLMVRYQNYPDLETVEEEAERLAAEAEATPPRRRLTRRRMCLRMKPRRMLQRTSRRPKVRRLPRRMTSRRRPSPMCSLTKCSPTI